jgi:hypothetical protein
MAILGDFLRTSKKKRPFSVKKTLLFQTFTQKTFLWFRELRTAPLISSAITLVPLGPPNCYNSHALCLVPSDKTVQFFYRVYQNLLLIQLALSWTRPAMSIGPAFMYEVPCRS